MSDEDPLAEWEIELLEWAETTPPVDPSDLHWYPEPDDYANIHEA